MRQGRRIVIDITIPMNQIRKSQSCIYTASTLLQLIRLQHKHKHMQSRLGMNQTLASAKTASGAPRKRPAQLSTPKRDGPVYTESVTVTEITILTRTRPGPAATRRAHVISVKLVMSS